MLCVPRIGFRIGFRNPRRLRVCSGEETAVAHHSQRPGLNTATTSLLPATTSAPSPHLGCRALLRSRIWLPSRQTAYTVEGNRRLWARSASKICTWQQLQAARLMQSNAQSRGGQPPTSFPSVAARTRSSTDLSGAQDWRERIMADRGLPRVDRDSTQAIRAPAREPQSDAARPIVTRLTR